ncbi:aminodeoxychorismate/anthranilate synthase component II [Nitratidesulfovibrio sp. D1]|uniref:aminodeoxychorismate/anthranilate synthase component II n=1 Tax=Nitratidesulfovibrio sp. D1 TaxID=3440151 RepID=UPI003EBE07D5
MRILLADNHDSFTRNLEHLLVAATGCVPIVVPADRLAEVTSGWPHASGDESPAARWDLLVISPGPGAPVEYPQYAPLLGGEDTRVAHAHAAAAAPPSPPPHTSNSVPAPVLGICLGLQIINAHFGGVTAPLPGCVHGKPDTLHYAGQTRTVARYHSLHLSAMGAGMRVLARNGQGVVMAARHECLPLLGYQFHPESFLTPDGVWWIRHALHALGLR